MKGRKIYLIIGIVALFVLFCFTFWRIAATKSTVSVDQTNTSINIANMQTANTIEKQSPIPAKTNKPGANQQTVTDNVYKEPTHQPITSKKFGWSFVRNKNNKQPRFESAQSMLGDKYNCIYIGNSDKKSLYLTFDEGYENGYTSKILDVLKDNNVKAAFFITKPYLDSQPELVKRMVNEGHIVGNHTVHHPSMPDVKDDSKLEEELLGLDRAFHDFIGKPMKYLRPPKGEYDERTLRLSSNLDYTNVFWSMAYVDWDVNNQKGVANAMKMVSDNLHNGAVILLHAVSKDNAEALDSIIKDALSKGYTFETLDNFNR
jgi:peptidoglycan-N-acetylmuramic acid deacetylase